MASRGTDAWRREHWGNPCDFVGETIDFAGTRIHVAKDAAPAFEKLGLVFEDHEYPVRRSDTGSYNCRVQKGTNIYSSHAYGLAVDVNWNSNPFRRPLTTDIPQALIDDTLRIKTTQRWLPVFRWGGYFSRRPDPMHWEIMVTPAELALGVWPDGIVGQPRERILFEGLSGTDVEDLQRALGLVADGNFGGLTDQAVRGFQCLNGLVVDGMVGPVTRAEIGLP